MTRNPRGLSRIGSWLTGRPAPPPKAADMLQAVTRSAPIELLTRIRQRPFDPKLIELFSQDSLARQKGWGLYEMMLDDAQVRAVTTIKRYAPTSNGWKINPADTSSEAIAIADFTRDNLLDLNSTLENITGQILESTFTGLSISESVYRVEKHGKYKGKILLSDVQTRPPSMIDVDFDASGKVVGILRADSYGSWEDVGVSPFKFVVHTWDGRYGSPYGRGDGRAVYKHWWAKDFLMRAWALYIDKFGSPSIIGRQTPNMSQEELHGFEELLKNVQHEGYSILPAEWQIDWLFPPGGGGNAQAFLTAIEWHDSMIAKAVLGSTLSTDENRGTGSFAQAKVHADTRDLLLRRVKTEAETTIVTNQIIKRLVRMNFGREAAQTLCPKFQFSPPDLSEMQDLATIIGGLVTNKVVSAEEPWIRERLYIPAHEEVHEETQKVASANAEKDAQVAGVSAKAADDVAAGSEQRRAGVAHRQKLVDAAISRLGQKRAHQLGQEGADAQTARAREQAVLQAALQRQQAGVAHELGQKGADADSVRARQAQVIAAELQRRAAEKAGTSTHPATPGRPSTPSIRAAVRQRLAARNTPPGGTR